MNVLILALHRPLKPTGVCRHAANLARCLAGTAHIERVTLVVGDWQRHYFERSLNIVAPKIQLLPLNIKNSSLSRNCWYIFGLPKLARQLKPDIIHLSFPLPFVGNWFQVPIVSTIHDLYPYECPENFGYPQVWFNRGFLRQCVRSSHGLCCVSQVTLNSLNEFFPKKNTKQLRTVIYNYVDFDQADEVIPPESLTDKDDLQFILCVAQHRKNKNIDLLIQTYDHLLSSKVVPKSMVLVLVGSSGPETANLHEITRSLSIEKQVIFLSALSDRELCYLYKRCSLFVIPSSTEGFCLPLVEALFWGSKVVCSEIPIFQEVGSEACTYFKLEGNPVDNLSEAITTALSNNCIEFSSINHKFSNASIACKLKEFYTSVANSLS